MYAVHCNITKNTVDTEKYLSIYNIQFYLICDFVHMDYFYLNVKDKKLEEHFQFQNQNTWEFSGFIKRFT